MKVTLEDVYAGKTTKIAVNRKRLCAECEGRGGEKGHVKSCEGCNGQGMRTTMTMMGPGMYTQRTGPCDDCDGVGESIPEEYKCKKCKGEKVKTDKKILEV